MAPRIEDYALLGDTQAAALVGRDGSIDWLCLPRFDSAACFAALLGGPQNGRWKIAPADPVRRATRRYREGTLVLDTDFETDGGAIRLIDTMPPRGRAPDVVRVIEGLRGRVRVRMDLAIRFDYGSIVPWLRPVDGAVQAVAGPDALVLRTPAPLRVEGADIVAEFEVREGERVPFVITYYPSYEPPPEPLDAGREIDLTAEWWRAWSDRCTYEGPFRDAVRGSLVVLKALTYAPSGGIVAAPTTSLPEHIGGARNWDYRYCWLRDATMTLEALLLGGYVDEAAAFREWLVRAVAGDPAQLQIMYGVAGERRLQEWTIPWLGGYEGSRPVRVGNGAFTQLQLDVYGEVMDAMYRAYRHDLPPEPHAWEVLCGLLDFLATAWRDPDAGIWEMRGPTRRFTYAKVMCWVAFDRAVKIARLLGVREPVDRWQRLCAEIHADVCAKGFDARAGAFTQAYGSADLDASALRIPLVGFLPADDPRVIGTVRAIERGLVEDGLVLRYRSASDGFTDPEGAFLACSFWLVDCWARMGRTDEAARLFERLLSLRNDVGLLSEEYDPKGRRQLGNFPQGFSHLALIQAAYDLAQTSPPTPSPSLRSGEGARNESPPPSLSRSEAERGRGGLGG